MMMMMMMKRHGYTCITGGTLHGDFTGRLSFYRRIFVYTCCLINICLSLSDDANKIKTLNIERA